MAQSSVGDLGGERYLSLATFRRNGVAVETPMWCVAIDGRLYFFTDGTSAKVKRLRARSAVRVAPCTVRGGVTGLWRDGTGRIVDDAALCARVYDALARKYGWQMRLLNFGSRLGGRISRRAVIEVVP